MLTDAEVSAGRRVKFEGEELDVLGAILTTNSLTFLVVSKPNNPSAVLVSQARIQETGEAIPEEQVQQARDDHAAQAVTGGTGVTVPQDTPPPAPAATTTTTTSTQEDETAETSELAALRARIAELEAQQQQVPAAGGADTSTTPGAPPLQPQQGNQ